MSLKTWFKARQDTQGSSGEKASKSSESPKISSGKLPNIFLEEPKPSLPIEGGAVKTSSVDVVSSHRAVKAPKTDTAKEVVAYASDQKKEGVLKALPRGVDAVRNARARFYDPLSLMYATGFRDRRYSLTYDVMRRTSYQLSLIGAIIKTRCEQIASFSKPYRESRQVGFQIRFKDESKQPTEEDKAVIRRLEQFISECGWGQNPYSQFPRDPFGVFLKKFTRDSLTYDQATFEIVPDQDGRPAEFHAVDASTIRLASTYDGYRGEENRKFHSKEFTDRWQKEYGDFELDDTSVFSVQVLHGRIENIFTQYDMAIGIRNPRSDIWVNGYGFGEIEMCLNTILRTLWAEEYNARNFRQGSMANGILNFKGDNFGPEQLEAFKRTWQAQIVGVENAHRIPLIQVPEGVEFVNLGRGNKEMEYKSWLEYLIKIISGTYGMDPAEINFDLVGGAGGGKAPMFEGKHEWKIKFSKDKGLRPLLGFVAETLNKYVIDPLDSRFYLDFLGLDHMTEQERIELLTKRTTNYLTINEARKEEGLDPVPGGDIINSPTFFQAYQAESGDQSKKKAMSPFEPWRTAGEHPELEYGQASPVPLYLQTGDEMLSPPSAQGGDAGAMGGDPNAQGGPPMGGPPSQ